MFLVEKKKLNRAQYAYHTSSNIKKQVIISFMFKPKLLGIYSLSYNASKAYWTILPSDYKVSMQQYSLDQVMHRFLYIKIFLSPQLCLV